MFVQLVHTIQNGDYAKLIMYNQSNKYNNLLKM